MHKNEELLTIGEMAKLSGAGIRALHYYERKGVLEPAYIDPDTGYRYYSYDQINYADMIKSCINLGIPLKDFPLLSCNDDYSLLHDFFVRNKEAAEEKIKTAKVMSALADKALLKIEQNRRYNLGQQYSREYPEKTYYVQSCVKPSDITNRTKVIYDFIYNAKNELNITTIDEKVVLMEYGFLYTCSPDDIKYYVFWEIPRGWADNNIITIPSDTYPFRQDTSSNINDAPQIFEEHLTDMENYMVIEVEDLMSGKSKIHEPIYELRLIVSDRDIQSPNINYFA